MHNFIIGTIYSFVYFAVLASTAVVLRKAIRIPDELFRKFLHCILLGSLFIYVFKFDTWWHAALSCILFAAILYPVLIYLGHFNTFSQLLTERKEGELKNSLLVVFSMYAVVISICWGIFGDRLLVIACVFAWGLGDAAAALIGKRFGKHKIPNTSKSYEGTLSMFLISLICVLTVLLLRGGMIWYAYILTALPVAAASAAVELYTPSGYDTFTCPIAAMIVMIPLLHIFGGLI